MSASETKLKVIEGIYSEVVERLDATTKLFNEFRDSLSSVKDSDPRTTASGHPKTHSNIHPPLKSVDTPSRYHEELQRASAQQPSFIRRPQSNAPYQLSPATYGQPYNCSNQQPCYVQLVQPQNRFACGPQTTGGGECIEVQPLNNCQTECEKLGAVELLLLLTDNYIQQCEGYKDQQENKTKLCKLRKKILVNRNCKPKVTAKLMSYVQTIGADVVKASECRKLERRSSCEKDIDEGEEKYFKCKTSSRSRRNISPKRTCTEVRAVCKPRCPKTQTRSCLINGVEAVPVGQVIPVGVLENNCNPNSGVSTQHMMPSYQPSNFNTQEVNFASNHEVFPPTINSNHSQVARSSDVFQSNTRSNLQANINDDNLENASNDQLQTSGNYMGGVSTVSFGKPSVWLQSSTPPLIDPEIEESNNFLPAASQYQPQNAASHVTQHSASAYPSQHGWGPQPGPAKSNIYSHQSQQIYPPNHPYSVNSMHQPSTHQHFSHPRIDPSNIMYQDHPEAHSVIGVPSRSVSVFPRQSSQVHSQGTQCQDVEFLIHQTPEGNTAFCLTQDACGIAQSKLKRVCKPKKCRSIRRLIQECSDDEDFEKTESMMEKLERKSLNCPEGSLVTDGVNVFYITRPSENADSTGSEEVVVNIPIKGSNIIKTARESSKKDCSKCVQKRRSSKCRRSECKESCRRSSETVYEEEEDPDDEHKDVKLELCEQSQKKKAKSLYPIADFEACICSYCIPGQDEGRPSTGQRLPSTLLTEIKYSTPIQSELEVYRSLSDVIKDDVNNEKEENTKESLPKLSIDPPFTIPTVNVELLADNNSDDVQNSKNIIPIEDSSPPKDKSVEKDSSATNVSQQASTLVSKIEPLAKISEVVSEDERSLSIQEPSLTDPPDDLEGKILVANTLQAIKKKECLQQVFHYLDLKSLTRVSEVCREWKAISRRPLLWKNIDIVNERISSKFLKTLSGWCTQINSISLQNLKTPRKRRSHPIAEFLAEIEGSLEEGLVSILRASHINVTTISIIGCSNLFTDKIMWAISSFCPFLKRMAYVSAYSPAGRDSLWGLGTGCRFIDTLLLPPVVPCRFPTIFDDECCEVIGRSWPNLKVLCIGGEGVTSNGLVLVAKLCQDLQILKLDRSVPVTKQLVQAMTYVGLKNLELVELNHTNITAEALKAFGEGCPKLAKFNYEGEDEDETQPSRRGSHLKDEQAIKEFSEYEKKVRISLDDQEREVYPGQSDNSSKEKTRHPHKEEKRSHHKGSRREERRSSSLSPRLSNHGELERKISKEEQERIYEARLLAAKRLNAKTAKELAISREEKQHRLSQERESGCSTNDCRTSTTETKVRSKTLDELREELRGSGSQNRGANLSAKRSRTSEVSLRYSDTNTNKKSLDEWKEDIRNSSAHMGQPDYSSEASQQWQNSSNTNVNKKSLDEWKEEIRRTSSGTRRGSSQQRPGTKRSNTTEVSPHIPPEKHRKSLQEWKEEVRQSNPQGAKLSKKYRQSTRSSDANFHHQSLETQLRAQSERAKTSRTRGGESHTESEDDS